MKQAFLLLLVLIFQVGFAYEPYESSQALASAFIKSATINNNLFPRDLIYPSCFESLPPDQKAFFNLMPIITIFEEEDLRYEIKMKEEPPLEGLSYCVEPEKEIVIYHKNWNPTVPAARIDIAKVDGSWFIVIPVLSEQLFTMVKESSNKYIDEFKNALNTLETEHALSWRRMLESEKKYEAIHEVSSYFKISDEASLLLLSYIQENY